MSFIKDIVTILTDGGAGVVYESSNAQIPTGSGPYLSVQTYGGRAPDYIQNQLPPAYEHPSIQVTARAMDPDVAEAKAREAYNLLAGVRNTIISGGVRYLYLKPMQEPFDGGKDKAGRVKFIFNVMAEKVPS